jgi:hypothetical protein
MKVIPEEHFIAVLYDKLKNVIVICEGTGYSL